MPSYLFKADGIDIALPVTPQGDAWSWLELGSGGPSIYLWLINLYAVAPTLELSTEDDFPRVAGGMRPLLSDSSGDLLAQELDVSLDYVGRIYRITRTGVIRYTEETSSGNDEVNLAWFDDLGRVWGEIAAGDDVVKVFSDFDYVAHTRIDTVSGSFGAGQVALFFRGGDIAGRMYASRRDAAGVQRFGYFNAAGVWVPLVTYTGTGGGRGMVGSDGNLYIMNGDIGQRDRFTKYDQDGAFISEVVLTDADPSDMVLTSMLEDALGRVWIQGTGSATANAWCVNAGTMEVEIFGIVDNAKIVPGQDYDGQAAVALIENPPTGRNQIGVFQFAPLISASDVDLGVDVIRPLCLMGDLESGDVDVSDLIGIPVTGYLVSSRGALREMIEPLMGVYLFDGVESDDVIKFVLRGGPTIVTIPHEQLGAAQNDSSEDVEFLSLSRKQEMELPSLINFAYMNANGFYEVAQQPSRRLITDSMQEMTISCSIVLTDDRAKRAVDAMMMNAWVERKKGEWGTSRRYEMYEPTDVLFVERDGILHRFRIVQKDSGVNGVLQWQAVAEEPSIYEQFANGAPSPDPNAQINPPTPTIAELLDIPMLRAFDNDPGFYYGAYGAVPATWPGSILFQSVDGGASYNQLANTQLINPSAVGGALTVLPTMPVIFGFPIDTGFFEPGEETEMFDETSFVDIRMSSGMPSSATRAQLLLGANAALLGREVLQFRTVTVIDANTVRLSGFLRGRLGTEWAMGEHAIGDRFVLLNENLLRTVTQTFGQINNAYLYKPVSLGSTLQHTAPQPFTNTGVRRKPLAPWRFAGGRNMAGDLIMLWKPRTRFEVIFGLGVTNLSGETEERYAVYIPSFAAPLRVITSTTPTVTYTAAQQIEDYGMPMPLVSAEVCQVSPEAGLGYFTAGEF